MVSGISKLDRSCDWSGRTEYDAVLHSYMPSDSRSRIDYVPEAQDGVIGGLIKQRSHESP